MNRNACLLGGVALLLVAPALSAQDRKTQVLTDREHVEQAGYWIYNDLERGKVEARRTGQPMLVVFRCIP